MTAQDWYPDNTCQGKLPTNISPLIKPFCRTTLDQEDSSLCLCFSANSYLGQEPRYREIARERGWCGCSWSSRKCVKSQQVKKAFFLKQVMKDKLEWPFSQTYRSKLKTISSCLSHGGPSRKPPRVHAIKVILVRQPYRRNQNACDSEWSPLYFQWALGLFSIFQLSKICHVWTGWQALAIQIQ